MLEATGDLWTYPADYRVITTNGAVRRDGRAVMGRGCAREAALRFPQLPRLLGEQLTRDGNHVHYFGGNVLDAPFGLFTFPVKHHWSEKADLALISRSTAEPLAEIRPIGGLGTYVMPRAGCGNGQLRWADVQPILAVLPDRVVVIDYAR